MKFLRKKDYDDLVVKARMVDALNDECERLANLITAETKDCKMGPWCKDCAHLGRDSSEVNERAYFFGEYTVMEAGKVRYCKKHLHEICPEHETR